MDPDHTEDTIRALLGEARRPEAPLLIWVGCRA